MCEICGRGGDFEILTDGSDIQEDSRIDEHVTLIRNGYSDCEHITDTSQTKVP